MSKTYKFLPFRFKRFGKQVLLVNDIGEFCFLDQSKFQEFVEKHIDISSEDFLNLHSKHMACTDHLPQTIELLATAYRSKKSFLYDFTSLHMFVITHRCNQKCIYCHASSEDADRDGNYDMDSVTAIKCVDLALCSPCRNIKIEFQGGEPLLNFEVIKEIVEYTEYSISQEDRNVEFVICSNLTKLSASHLDFFEQHNISISTSLDGPKQIHDQCRKTRKGMGTYDIVKNHMEWAVDHLGRDKVSALMTVTAFNLNHLNAVIDEYLESGLPSIFIRMINPHGSALDEWKKIGYTVSDFVQNYKKALDYIIDFNCRGIFFPEEFATLLLTKILTPFSIGFVDLQSPAGAGLGAAVYEINGDVYIADEARMIAKKTGDKTFCLGNVNRDSYHSMFCGNKLANFAKASTIEAVPGCAWCAYQPYCGSDPIRNFIQFGNFGWTNSKSDFCKKHKTIFDIMFNYFLQNREQVYDVFWSWITR